MIDLAKARLQGMAMKANNLSIKAYVYKSTVIAIALSFLFSVFASPASASEKRTRKDRPDSISGFQIKPVLLLPSDSVDTRDDVNGVIAALLDEGIAFLESELGRSFPIDRTKSGNYDIAVSRSNYSESEFLYSEVDLHKILFNSKLLKPSTPNRKIYVFFAPIDSLRDGEVCGLGQNPGRVSLVAYSGLCGGAAYNMGSYASSTWVHEVFHNVGIDHTSEFCDLMSNEDGCTSDNELTIDANQSLYAGASRYGPDILKQGIWNGKTKPNQKNQPLGCVGAYKNEKSYEAIFYSCPVGARIIGSHIGCWDNPKKVKLQELRKGKWKTIKNLKYRKLNAPWGKLNDWGSCKKGDEGPSAKVTVKKASTKTYRWVVDGYVGKKFKVVWQN
jgi:hypothetical protein